MAETLSACSIAALKIRQGISFSRRFPRNVFVGDWSCFLFFDADWIQDAAFVDRAKEFLDAENATCACLMNLDRGDESEPGASFFIDRHTTPEAYKTLLLGSGSPDGWLFDMSRLACCSNVGEWAMYCEPVNEIAVIGFRDSGSFARYQEEVGRFHATWFDQAIEDPALAYGFSERALSKSWRDEFLREYATRVS